MQTQAAAARTAPSAFTQGWATSAVPIPVCLSSCVLTGFAAAGSPQGSAQLSGARFMKGRAEEAIPATTATPRPIACFSRQAANASCTATVATEAASSTTSPGKSAS